MIKQREANSWKSVSYAKSISGAQTYTKFPIVLRTTDQSIPTWSMDGNVETSGIPSSLSPITINGCGDRTANLLNADTYYGTYKQQDGTYQATRGTLYNVQIKPFTAADIGKTFTFSGDLSPTTGNARLCATVNGVIVGGSNAEHSVVTFTVATVDDTIFFNYGSGSTTNQTLSNLMLNEGQPMNYEPYGYKIPITSNQTALTPVYLTEQLMKIDSMNDELNSNNILLRKIRKMVCNGSENWDVYSAGTSLSFFYLSVSANKGINTVIMCTHYERKGIDTATSTVGIDLVSDGTIIRLRPQNVASDFPDLNAWTTYLQQQYENGTPVTILYALNTATTEAITVPTIPTTSGLNAIDVDTTVKPSEMSLTYDGYKLCKGQRYSRTENLFNGVFEQGTLSESSATGSTYEQTKSSSSPTNRIRTAQLVTCGGEVTISCDFTKYQLYILYYDTDGQYTGQHSSNWNSSAVTTNQQYIGIAIRRLNNADLTPNETDIKLMVNSGSTAKPYQPYLDWE